MRSGEYKEHNWFRDLTADYHILIIYTVQPTCFFHLVSFQFIVVHSTE